jgi:two-component system sensor histidine kinase AlgZ
MTTPLPPAIPDQLPDFRNLGVVLRVMASVLTAMAALALAQPGDPTRWFISASAIFAPSLLLAMAALAVLSRWLASRTYRMGCALVHAIALAAWGGVYGGLLYWGVADRDSAWRQALCVVVLTQLISGYFRLRGRALSPLLTEARLQALQARIRPHFLFNSLNAVLSLIRSEPRKAERAIEDLSDLFRVFMAENRELSTLAREVALARQYLAIESLRLGGRLQVSWHTDNMPLDAAIPPLTLQPLLENAVYHGIEPFSAPGTLTINIFRVRNELHIDLRNPYLKEGGLHHAGNKMAMSNIRERLALHFDAEASLKTTVGNDYYQVHLTLPYRPLGTP